MSEVMNFMNKQLDIECLIFIQMVFNFKINLEIDV